MKIRQKIVKKVKRKGSKSVISKLSSLEVVDAIAKKLIGTKLRLSKTAIKQLLTYQKEVVQDFFAQGGLELILPSLKIKLMMEERPAKKERKLLSPLTGETHIIPGKKIGLRLKARLPAELTDLGSE